MHENLIDTVFHCAPGEWRQFLCKKCGSGYLDPRPTPGTIGLAYKNYFTHETTPEIVQSIDSPMGYVKTGIKNDYLRARYGVSLYPRIPLGRFAVYVLPYRRLFQDSKYRHLPLPGKSAKLLDIGCGNGDFLRIASSIGWDAVGLEPDPIAVEAAKKNGVTVVQGGFPHTGLPGGQFDAVTLRHVIEHLHDPIAALREVHRLLKPAGKIWITTPNLKSVGHRFFKEHWRGLEPPRHLVIFSASSLALACERAGFVNTVFKSAPPVAAWYFLSSLGISRKKDSRKNDGGFLPVSFRWLARWADLKGFMLPESGGEEMIAIATKP